MLAVLAHPDDETLVGPVLARYAREGVKVYLAIATKGEKGANDRAAIPAGEALAKVRREESACACRQLGIEPPILFELNDGELGAISNPLGYNIQEVADHVEKLIAELHPAVVVTWGADGGYGHPDHRLASEAVTQAIQAAKTEVRLFYIGFSPEQVKFLNEVWALPCHGTRPIRLILRCEWPSRRPISWRIAGRLSATSRSFRRKKGKNSWMRSMLDGKRACCFVRGLGIARRTICSNRAVQFGF